MNYCEIPGQSLRATPDQVPSPSHDIPADKDRGEAVLAGGCFWCTEAVFRRLNGVREVQPGYAGGAADVANYQAVCNGSTGHAEVIRIVYDPNQISFGQLLKVFFAVAHDPTQKNRQGSDVGTQYRSAVFYLDSLQREVTQAYIDELNVSGLFAEPIVTTLEPLEAFFVAESYHHDYAARNPGQPYILAVSQPKVEKLERYFIGRLNRD